MSTPSLSNYNALIDAGWSHDVATALNENGVTPEASKHLSTEEALEMYLMWEGIIGYTFNIIDAVDNCRDQATRKHWTA